MFFQQNRKRTFGLIKAEIFRLQIQNFRLCLPWLSCHFLFPLFFISHICLMNDSKISHMNDNNISHQTITVVVPCSKSAQSAHWLFLIHFFMILMNIYTRSERFGSISIRIHPDSVHLNCVGCIRSRYNLGTAQFQTGSLLQVNPFGTG